jgi:hypothetical protein
MSGPPTADFSLALKVFDQCAKTFWIYDAAARAGKRVDLKMGALCSDWNTLMSSKGNYIIEVRDAPRTFAKRPREEMEQIQALYKHVMPVAEAHPALPDQDLRSRRKIFQAYSGGLRARPPTGARCRRRSSATGSKATSSSSTPRKSSRSPRRRTPRT